MLLECLFEAQVPLAALVFLFVVLLVQALRIALALEFAMM